MSKVIEMQPGAEETAPTNGKPETIDKATYLQALRNDLAKLEEAAEAKKQEHLVLLGKAEAFRELLAYHEKPE